MTKIEKTKSFIQSVNWKEISSLVIPQVLLMFTTLFVSLTDTWVAGKISPPAQASIGVIGQIQAFVMVLAMSLGSGAMAVISQSLGAKKYDRVKKYTLLVLMLALALALIFSLLGYSLGSFILGTLNIPQEVQPIALYFWDLLLLALPFHYIYFVSNVLFRAAKLVKRPLFIGFIVCVFNLFGDLAFGLGYFGFEAYGIAGVAWTTVFSVFTGALLSVLILIKEKMLTSLTILSINWIKKAAPYLFKVALPALAMQALWQTGYLVLFGVAASVQDSTAVLAGLTAGMRIESILFMPAVAFNATAAILVGHALGSGNVEEAKKIGITVCATGVLIMSTVGFVMLPFIDELAGFFTEDPHVIYNIRWYLIFNIFSTPFTIGTMVLSGIMTGAGATIYSLIFNTTGVWCIRLPLAYFLAHNLEMGSKGVYLAMLISTVYQCSTMLYVFYGRPWYRHAMNKNCKNAQ